MGSNGGFYNKTTILCDGMQGNTADNHRVCDELRRQKRNERGELGFSSSGSHCRECGRACSPVTLTRKRTALGSGRECSISVALIVVTVAGKYARSSTLM